MALDHEHLRLELRLPGLEDRVYEITSEQSTRYNCIAWALGETHRNWDPFGFDDDYWPPEVPAALDVGTFVSLFEHQDFEVCDSGGLDAGVEKIALFADDGLFTHVARQLPSGRWTSKLGNDCDIEHDLEDLVRRRSPSAAYRYGEIVGFLRRPRRLSGDRP